MARKKKKAKVKFGSKAWVARALQRKFAQNPENSEERIGTMSEYLNFRKLHGILWPRKTAPGKVIWIEPESLRRREPDHVIP
ncbi:MAG: hypothetical protein ABUS51_10915 [Acidobacteriota bacterium]